MISGLIQARLVIGVKAVIWKWKGGFVGKSSLPGPSVQTSTSTKLQYFLFIHEALLLGFEYPILDCEAIREFNSLF